MGAGGGAGRQVDPARNEKLAILRDGETFELIVKNDRIRELTWLRFRHHTTPGRG
jgi:hypothetical protein